MNHSTYQSFNLSTYQPINLSTYQSINLSTYQPINLSTYQSINLSIYQSINLSISQSINQSINQSTCKDSAAPVITTADQSAALHVILKKQTFDYFILYFFQKIGQCDLFSFTASFSRHQETTV